MIRSNIDNTYPLPGDFVRVSRSSDKLIPNDTLGVVVGEIGVVSEKIMIVFEPLFPILVSGNRVIAKGRITEELSKNQIYSYSSSTNQKSTIQNLIKLDDKKYTQPELVFVKNLFCTI